MTRPLKPFDYFEPKSVEEAVQILFMHGGEARAIAGGVDLVPRMRRREIQPRCVVCLQKIPQLNYLKSGSQGLRIGALTTLRSLELSPVISQDYRPLHDAISEMASLQVKNMGTAVGNLCVATPASDVAVSLLVLGAQLKIAGTAGERTMPIEKFFIGVGQTVLQPGEIVIEILLPRTARRKPGAFLKLVRSASDVAKVNVAVSLTLADGTCQNAKIALGSVAPTIFRATQAEAALKGQKLVPRTLAAAAQAAAEAARPIDDLRSTAEYRREMVRVLVKRALEKATQKIAIV